MSTLDPAVVIARYQAGDSAAVIAEALNSKKSKVICLLRAHRVALRPRGGSHVQDGRPSHHVPLPKADLEAQLRTMPARDIAALVQCSSMTIYRWAAAYGINTRALARARKAGGR